MKYIYHCNACHYTFERAVLPDRCPDCGKMAVHIANGTNPAVRPATDAEIAEYECFQREILKEIAERVYKN